MCPGVFMNSLTMPERAKGKKQDLTPAGVLSANELGNDLHRIGTVQNAYRAISILTFQFGCVRPSRVHSSIRSPVWILRSIIACRRSLS